MALRFALNRMAAPRIPFGAFCAMAQRLGASAIEIRNDLVNLVVLKAADHDFCFRLSATGGGGSWFLMPPIEEEAA